MPLNRVVVGAPSATAVPACVFAWVGKQLSAATLELLELLDDVLDEELAELVLLEELTLLDELTELDELELTDEELTELTLLDELTELTLLEELELTELTLLDELTELDELTDEELTLDETLLLEEPVAAAVAVVGSAPEPLLHAVTNKQRLVTKLARRKRVRVFMIRLPRCSSSANKMVGPENSARHDRVRCVARSVLNNPNKGYVEFPAGLHNRARLCATDRREMLTGHEDDLRGFVRLPLSLVARFVN